MKEYGKYVYFKLKNVQLENTKWKTCVLPLERISSGEKGIKLQIKMKIIIARTIKVSPSLPATV